MSWEGCASGQQPIPSLGCAAESSVSSPGQDGAQLLPPCLAGRKGRVCVHIHTTRVTVLRKVATCW